jgi:uncharacterized repeat protein (TIGR03803 family)
LVLNSNNKKKRNQSIKFNCMKTGIFTQKTNGNKTTWQRLAALLTAAFLFLASTSLQAQDVLMGLTSNGGPEGKGTAFSIRTDTKAYNVINSFVDWGSRPESELVRGTDGYLYGMTPNGGTYGHGTLFKISTTGDITILKHFNYYAEGGNPKGSLIQATDGNFYGMLNGSSTYSGGAIFKMTPGGQFSVIKNLSLGTDGGGPNGRLLQASDGSFYGINTSGGAFGYGTIFRLTLGGVYSVLKAFNGTTEGANSYGSLIQASNGALYGMTRYGGDFKSGVIFRIETTGGYKVIKHLNSATDAAGPRGNLVQGKDGWLYGMSPSGSSYNGVIFKINMEGTKFSLLHNMNPGTDGGNPHGSLIQGKDGFFYGTTYLGGGSGYSGTVFKMATNGDVFVVKRFTEASEGGYSSGSVIQTPDGMLYGMTNSGGKNLKGTIYKLTTGGSITILSHLNGVNAGSEPVGNLVVGKDSAYFGVTKTGGAFNYGTIFKICGGVTTILKSFNRTDGEKPVGGLLRGKDGNLYGMTEYGGTNGVGTIFRYTASGTFSVLRHMNASTDGGHPQGTLVQGANGLLYGVAYSGGPTGSGTIFRIGTSGGTTFKVLRSLVYSTDGDRLLGGLTIGKDRAFYGMTSNNTRFFRIDTLGNFTVKKTMSYSTDGGTPYGNLLLGTDGNFYGTMSSGGASFGGVIFRITPDGLYTKLRQLNPALDGSEPKGSLVQGSDGAIYGTTSKGGTNNVGTIFKLSGTGFTTYTVLKHLKMETDGGTPIGGLIIAPKITLVANGQSGLTTTEDVARAITLTGTGAPNLTFNVLIRPRHGVVTGGTLAARTYTPAANYFGVDSFAFTANLGCLSSAPAWVKINVTPVNDTPKLATINTQSVMRGTQLRFLATAVDPDPGQTKTFSLIGAPAGAVISATTGLFTWTPSVTGTFTFKVRVTDNGSPVLFSEQTVTVTVTATATTTLVIGTATTELSMNQKAEEKGTAASLFPNPVVSSFTVKLNKQVTEVTLRITDAKGAVVHQKQYNGVAQQLQIDATALKAGQYFVTLQTAAGTEVLKLTKL